MRSIVVNIWGQLGKDSVQTFTLAIPEQEFIPAVIFGVFDFNLTDVTYNQAFVPGFLFQVGCDQFILKLQGAYDIV